VGNLYSLTPGDILQLDKDKNGNIDHSMIVTKKDPSGMIYLTYHSDSQKDFAFDKILSKYPNANYYGWKLYDSFI